MEEKYSRQSEQPMNNFMTPIISYMSQEIYVCISHGVKYCVPGSQESEGRSECPKLSNLKSCSLH